MPATFDGTTRIITLPSSTNTINVEQDLYSDWKEFVKVGNNAKFPAAFRTIGGDTLTGTLDAAPYFFLQNDRGWRIRPAEEDATVAFIGNLIAEDSTLPIIIPTIGAFTVLIIGLQPITQTLFGTDEQAKVRETWELHALDVNKPLVVDDLNERRTAGSIDQEVITDVALEKTTVTRLPSESITTESGQSLETEAGETLVI